MANEDAEETEVLVYERFVTQEEHVLNRIYEEMYEKMIKEIEERKQIE